MNLIQAPKAGYAYAGKIKSYDGVPPHLTVTLDNIKIFYTARSRKELKAVFNLIKSRLQLTNENTFANILHNKKLLTGYIELKNSNIIILDPYQGITFHKDK